MRAAIIGGTGFVGSYLTDAILRAGQEVALLVRKGSEGKLRQAGKVRVVSGDITNAESIRRLLEGCDAVIYNVGILREVRREGTTFESTQYQGLVNTVNAALEVGVQRLLLMSANGVKIPGTRYQETKRRAEDFAFASGLDVTVFRPSVIFGDPRGTKEFATQLFREMVRPPIPAVNFVASGNSKGYEIVMSPIHVEDVASAFVVALQDDDCIGKTYALGGPDVLTWKAMVSTVARAVGRHKWFLSMPIGLMYFGATLFDRLPIFPVTRDQLRMLEEGNVADSTVVKNLIGRQPAAFSAANLKYLGN